MTLITALERQRQEFEASLVYRMSFRTARATVKPWLSKNKNGNQNQNNKEKESK